MMDSAAQSASANGVEFLLREELAAGDAAAVNVSPILRHLLDNGANSMFSDAIISGVRGMVSDLARQLLDSRARASGEAERVDHPAEDLAALANALSASPALLGHLHALACEWQLTQQLHARLAMDPVLSPLLQAQMASTDSETASLAMKLLAAQARYCQEQRRMQLALTELPGDLLHGVLVAMRTLAGVEEDAQAAAAEATIRLEFHEARTRLGLAARLIAGMGGAALSALSVSHAGTALFLTALSLGSGQEREVAVMSINETQLARLALSLRASGLKQPAVEEQFLALHPDIALPEGFDQVSPDQAAAMLAASSSLAGI
ncbi:MAG: hypothetical protein ABIM50_13360 [Novosphingobium sp.]